MKVNMAAKDQDLYLTRSELLRNVFFMDRLKAAVMTLVLLYIKYIHFFLLIFISLFIFPYFTTKYFKLLYFSNFYFKTECSFEFSLEKYSVLCGCYY